MVIEGGWIYISQQLEAVIKIILLKIKFIK